MSTSHSTRFPRHGGDESRQRILCALRDRHGRGEPPPTIDELAAATDLSKTNTLHHVEWLEESGELSIQDALREVTRKVVVLKEAPEVPE